MHRGTLIAVLGIIVALSPFVGLPYAVLRFVMPVLGVFIVLISLSYRSSQTVSSTSTQREE